MQLRINMLNTNSTSKVDSNFRLSKTYLNKTFLTKIEFGKRLKVYATKNDVAVLSKDIQEIKNQLLVLFEVITKEFRDRK